MDFLKGQLSGHGKDSQSTTGTTSGGGVSDRVNGGLGGGPASEKNEDLLDKGVDFVQQRMGGGPQNNESAAEQAKDEQISDAIRRGYKSATGSDIPIKDK